MKSSHSTKTLNAFLHNPDQLPPALARLKNSEVRSHKKRPQASRGSPRKNGIKSLPSRQPPPQVPQSREGASFMQEPWRFEAIFDTAKRRVAQKEASVRWAPNSALRTCKSTPHLTPTGASASNAVPLGKAGGLLQLPPRAPPSLPPLSRTVSKKPIMPNWKKLEDAPLVHLTPRPLPGKLQYPPNNSVLDGPISMMKKDMTSAEDESNATNLCRINSEDMQKKEVVHHDSSKNTAEVEAPKPVVAFTDKNLAGTLDFHKKKHPQNPPVKKSVSKKSKASAEDRRESKEPPAALVGWPNAWNVLDDHSGYTQEEGRELYMTFKQALHEGDGEVDKAELPVVIKTVGFQLCDKQAIEKLSNEITHFSTLNFEQFLKFFMMYTSFERAEWQRHFDQFDEDKSGEVSVNELKLVLIHLGYTPLPEMLDEALKLVDDDGSGAIDLDEFLALLEHYRETEGFTKDEIEQLQDLFARFDRDEVGQLNSKDIYYLKRYLGLKGVKLDEDTDMRPLCWKGFLAEMRRYYEAEIAFFRKEFEAFDADKSGQINTTELTHVLDNLGFTPLKNMLDEVIAVVDKDGSNELDFFEFNRMMWLYRRSEGFTREEVAELEAVFDRYDSDKSGEISIMELGDILRYLGFIPNLKQMQKLVEEFDVDGSGDVGLTEFLKIMRQFREDEVKGFKEIFKRYDTDKSGSMATQEIAKVLRSLGHEVSMPIVQQAIAEVDLDGSGEVEWNEFVVLMDKYRRMAVRDKRHRCGFNDAQIYHYKTKFKAVDKDGSDDLNNTEITKLLTDLDMAPRTQAEQRQVLQLLEECRNLAEEQDGKTTFWVFLRLMRFLEDDKDRNSLTIERNAIEESKFSKAEVSEFREIFSLWASNDANSDLPGASKCGKSLGPEGMVRMLRSMGMTLTADDKEQLFKMAMEADQDGNGNVDFPDFLILMKRLIDANFCGLNQAAEDAANKKK